MAGGRTWKNKRWEDMWQTYMDFLDANHRRPSKYRDEERRLVNWLKHTRKLRNEGRLRDDRREPLDRLLREAGRYRRINQYRYADRSRTSAQERQIPFED